MEAEGPTARSPHDADAPRYDGAGEDSPMLPLAPTRSVDETGAELGSAVPPSSRAAQIGQAGAGAGAAEVDSDALRAAVLRRAHARLRERDPGGNAPAGRREVANRPLTEVELR
jgi:hypothetical protein